MADITSDDIAIIREWVGSDYSQSAIEIKWELHDDDRDATILAILNEQLADMLSTPANVQIEGALSIGQGDNIRALRERITQFRSTGSSNDGSVTSGVAKLHRKEFR